MGGRLGWSVSYLRSDIEQDSQQKFVVDGQGDELALVELRRRLSHHNAQADSPHQKQHFGCEEETKLR